MNMFGQTLGTWRIAMEAQGVGTNAERHAIIRLDRLTKREPAGSLQDVLLINEDRSWTLTWDECAITGVRSIDEGFLGHAQACVPSRRHECGAGESNQDEPAIHGGHRTDDRHGGDPIDTRLVIQRAMRLDMAHPDSFESGDADQGTDLVCHERFDLLGQQFDGPPSAARPVGKAGMGADRHTALFS